AIEIAPMEQQALCLRRDTPLARRQLAQLVHMLADFVDQDIACDSVFERELALLRPPAACGRHRNDLDAFSPARRLFAGRLTLLVKLEMPLGPIERGVDDRVFGKSHGGP